MKGQTFPGLSRQEVLELCPGLEVPADQAEILTEQGWYFPEHLETNEELAARAKQCMGLFKEMAKREDMAGKTVFAVSHGAFLNCLTWQLVGLNDRQVLTSGALNPLNNALTIIDFDVESKEPYNNAPLNNVVHVLPRLVAHNLQIIEN